jgi:hypothetical protein
MTTKVFNVLQTPEARAELLHNVLQDYLRVGFEAKTPPDAIMSGFMISIARSIVTVAASVHANNKNGETVDHITSDLLDFVEDFTYEALEQFKALPPSAVTYRRASDKATSQGTDHDS